LRLAYRLFQQSSRRINDSATASLASVSVNGYAHLRAK
jgi:hypothetical protein